MSAEQEQSYHGNGNHKWEGVVMDGGMGVTRLRVPGGWLYRDMKSQGIVFVPIPDVVKHKV